MADELTNSNNNNPPLTEGLTNSHNVSNASSQYSINNSDNNSNIAMQQSMDKPCDCGRHDGEKSMSSSPYPPPLPPRPSYVYAIGRVDYRFPDESTRHEFERCVSDYVRKNPEESRGLSDSALDNAVISNPDYEHLLSDLVWVFAIENSETYYLIPKLENFKMLRDAVRRVPKREDIDILVGMRGALTGRGVKILPEVHIKRLYASNIDEIISEIAGSPPSEPPSPPAKGERGKRRRDSRRGEEAAESAREDNLEETIRDILEKVMQIADNTGSSDEHRAINFLASAYPEIYYHTRDMFNRNYSFTGIDVKISKVSTSAEKVLDVIFTYMHRDKGTPEKWKVVLDSFEGFYPNVRKGFVRAAEYE